MTHNGVLDSPCGAAASAESRQHHRGSRLPASVARHRQDGGATPPPLPGTLRDTPRASSVLVAHGSPVIRFGLVALVRSSAGFRVCAEAASVVAASELAAREKADLALIGLTLDRGDGLELIKTFRRNDPPVPVVVVTAREDRESVGRAFRAGAHGYVLASEDTGEVIRALQHVAGGEFYASPRAMQHLLGGLLSLGATGPAYARIASLTDREMQIFRLIGAGVGPAAMAVELHVSVKTIEAHRQHIRDKLRLPRGTDLNAHAARWLAEGARQGRLQFLASLRRSRIT